jgi:hypothetical protein
VVVTVGLTACVPPVTCRVYALPSDPVTLTKVAFVAVTIKIDELPDVIEAGLAVMPMVGEGFAVTVTVAVAEVLPPIPVAEAV